MIKKKQHVLLGALLLFATHSWALEEAVPEVAAAVVEEPRPPLAAAEKPLPEKYTLTPTNKPIVVHPASPAFSIRLPAKAGTGYQWFLADYNPRMVKLLGQQYVAEKKKLVGATSMSVWDFQLQQTALAAPQVTHIVLEYRRMWELKAVKHQTFTVISSTER